MVIAIDRMPNKSRDGLTGQATEKMAADISVITEVARQASSFDFANPPDGANLDTWTIPQLKEFLRP